ncbi:hypothetical protein MKW98_003266 [Papaver atlanticum]|uniref:WAT1-related protein n=1 Tax=Papaver atlanticum TaxID=357466 RepID=A0AAD4TB08_9MAGN|nr:hypothetical protein MKW98_003266 [Papaver atlanticum]
MMKWLDEWQPAFLMVVIEFALATVNVLLKKVVDDGMDHLVLITYRTLFAAVFLAPMAYFWERKTRPKLTSRILCRLFISAMLGATVTQYGFLLGLQNTSETFTCAFINMVHVLSFLMALPFGLVVDIKSMSGNAKDLGTVVSVGGAMVLTLYKEMPITNISDSRETTSIHTTNHLNWLSPNNKTWTIGTIALILGSVFWSSWFLIQAKIGSKQCGTIPSQALLSLTTNQHYSSWVLKGRLQTITCRGIVGTGLSYVGMAYCVKKRGPVFTAAFSPLIQIVVAIFDFSILHQQLHLGSVLGSILVIIGLYILLWGKSKEAKACVTKQVTEAEDFGEIDQATKV